MPGRPDESPLFLAITRKHESWSAMPPKESEKLTEEQVGWLKAWILTAAPRPDPTRTAEILNKHSAAWSAEDGITVTTSGGQAPEWTHRKYRVEGLWAYQPVTRPQTTTSGCQAIDELLVRQMPGGLEPAAAADARTLIRRATFDLTGLPPTPKEIADFESEYNRDTDAAAQRLVDRLLDSPHYGEQMAQHWLDIVRYADSGGFANDYERGNAWRYRDYVVRAFNADKPYDQFVREQIAGDEMAEERLQGENGRRSHNSNLQPSSFTLQSSELIVATGFLRMGPWELTGMEVPKVARQRFLDDVTNSVGETFLAHSLQCARCHDHKFDPVPTRDYYAIQAVFATTQMAERPAVFLPVENVTGFDEKVFLDARFAELVDVLRALDEKQIANAELWFEDKGLDRTTWEQAIIDAREFVRNGGSLGARTRKFAGVFEVARTGMRKQGVPESQYPTKTVGFGPDDFGNERVGNKGLERLRWEFIRYEPLALSVYSGHTPNINAVYAPMEMPDDRNKGELESSCILTGGDPFSPGEPVRPGVLSVVGQADIPLAVEGRRRAFADWVASDTNPLTARVMVNRIWMWHFGEPLAGNPNNFGSTGKRPTNPELLDWLATKFIESDWSVKAMHRLILSSAAYRSTDFAPRRLSAEELRDAMLAATGELNRTLGGIPVRPEINLEAALQPRMVMGTFAAAWVPNPRPEQRHRRSLYTQKLRGLVDPMLEVFNAPPSDFSCERRESSTVTPQVFSLFNGQNVHARALALAVRAIRESHSDASAIERCFKLALSRPPTPEEGQLCLAHWQDLEARLPPAPPAQLPPLEVRREAVEENTGEKFAFTEKLHANAEFIPDLQPADAPPHARALADVCLVLLNSNEFAYVD